MKNYLLPLGIGALTAKVVHQVATFDRRMKAMKSNPGLFRADPNDVTGMLIDLAIIKLKGK